MKAGTTAFVSLKKKHLNLLKHGAKGHAVDDGP